MTDTTVATMTNVVAGAYVISAKTIVDPNGSGADWATTCTLDAGGGNTDIAEFSFDPDVSSVNIDHLATMNHAGHAGLPVDGVDRAPLPEHQRGHARMTKITAIKVDTVTREAVTG